MYEYLKGTLAVKKPAFAVLDVGGVAYRLAISLATYEALPPEGRAATVYTFLKVGQDELSLYGFATEEERRIFSELVGVVDGLGPRRALAILSSAPVATLRQIVDAGDAARLRRIKGIGPKLADKIIFELKGKLPKDEGLAPEAASCKQDAVQALVSLGYGRAEAEGAVERVLAGVGGKSVSAEELVRDSLRHV
jgi:Holliday junction DNA helicase RuvA